MQTSMAIDIRLEGNKIGGNHNYGKGVTTCRGGTYPDAKRSMMKTAMA